MSMNKKILVLAILLFLSSFAFALNTNTIQDFSLVWNENTNQLGINAQCRGEALGVLVLSTGAERTIICSSMNVGATWLIGEQSNDVLTGTLTIPAPCEVCDKTATISLSSPENKNKQGAFEFNQLGFGVIVVIVVIALGWIVYSLQR